MTWFFVFLTFQLIGVAISSRPGVPGSRRLLAGVLALMVPVAGTFLALMVRHGRGQGSVPAPERRPVRRVRISAIGVNRMNRLAPVLDRLMSPDAAERLAALVSLSSVADATAIATLRWTLDHGTTEVALDAALALDELDARREGRREATRQAFADAPSAERALELADAAADALVNRLGDGPSSAVMALTARDAYQVALGLAPERWPEIHERLAILELAAGQPEVALAHLMRVAKAPDVDLARLRPLRDRARFAARHFEFHKRPDRPAGASMPAGSSWGL